MWVMKAHLSGMITLNSYTTADKLNVAHDKKRVRRKLCITVKLETDQREHNDPCPSPKAPTMGYNQVKT